MGRRGDQGYCYLAYRKPLLSEEEKERLITIANNNHLGAGFEIALRDMEIRGAGDILGLRQSGQSKEVGLPLYFRMLEEKIAELQEQKSQQILTKIELPISFVIPDSYFLSELDKLNFFREAENIDTLDDLEAFEVAFRGGSDDTHIRRVFLLLRARLVFGRYRVEKISKNGNFYVFDFISGHSIKELKEFLDAYDQRQLMLVVSPERVRIETKYFDGATDFLQKLLHHT